ncbi:MAG: DUF6491 family protein [Caulobacterales bacterium]
MKAMIIGAALAALAAGAAFADPKPENAAPRFSIVQEDASIPFSTTAIDSYQVSADDSLVIRAGSRWYRATVWAPCARDLKFENAIAFDAGGNGTLDKFGSVYVNGQRCPIQSLDRIERPAPRGDS